MRPVLRRRALHAALMVAALTGGWSASAAALPPLPPPPITLPTITLPIVTVPPVTVPPVTTPVTTTPTLPIPPQAPPDTTTTDAHPPPSQPRDGSRPVGVGRSSGEASQGARAETSREQASRLRLAREWFIVFLPTRSLVELAVQEIAPECRLVG